MPTDMTQLDLNLCSARQILRTVNFVGPKKADSIIRHRMLHGPYKSVDELDEVVNFGKKLQTSLKDYFYVNPDSDEIAGPEGVDNPEENAERHVTEAQSKKGRRGG